MSSNNKHCKQTICLIIRDLCYFFFLLICIFQPLVKYVHLNCSGSYWAIRSFMDERLDEMGFKLCTHKGLVKNISYY